MLDITFGNLKLTKDGIRCDQKSDLCTPFVLETESQRETVVQGFRQYLASVVLHYEDPLTAAESIAAKKKLMISDAWKSRSITMIRVKKAVGEVYELARTSKITLLCHDAPARCHCQIIADYLNWVNRKNCEGDQPIVPIKLLDKQAEAWAAFPKVNKNDALRDYRYQEQPPPVRVIVTQSIELSAIDYDKFVENLLTPQEWLEGKGGHNTSGSHSLVLEILAYNRPAFYVNPQGHSYVRYVGFPVNADIAESCEMVESLGF